ncbi:MAG: 3-deoxy-7-phosphoheptulonate synthase [Planctomycetes bacterium]|nr:3-deoxy-7-phosphoheptulonate synthase [Planctomycetota bacterium]
MLVVMDVSATPRDVEAVCAEIRRLGFTPHAMPGASRTAIGITGNQGPIEAQTIRELAGVLEVIPVTKPYKLVSREVRPDDTVIRLPTGAEIGGKRLSVIAGPCSVETEERSLTIARRVRRAGATIFRGGAYKPRTSPYAFQGLGVRGLEILDLVRAETGLATCTEALDEESLERVAEHCDMIQIGARNMQNFSLLKKAGRAKKPVFLKRGMSATLSEYLQAAEYVLSEGNYQVVLCERGIRTFSDHSRNTFDVGVIPAAKNACHLPILADPSHASGKRYDIIPLARAAVAAGADGLMVEVHDRPEEALSDGAQSILPDQFDQLMLDVARIAEAVGRTV